MPSKGSVGPKMEVMCPLGMSIRRHGMSSILFTI